MRDYRDVAVPQMDGAVRVRRKPLPFWAQMEGRHVRLYRGADPAQWSRLPVEQRYDLPEHLLRGRGVCVTRGVFDATFDPMGPTRIGDDGIYGRHERPGWAVALTEEGFVVTEQDGRCVVREGGEGDYLVSLGAGPNRIVPEREFRCAYMNVERPLSSLPVSCATRGLDLSPLLQSRTRPASGVPSAEPTL